MNSWKAPNLMVSFRETACRAAMSDEPVQRRHIVITRHFITPGGVGQSPGNGDNDHRLRDSPGLFLSWNSNSPEIVDN
jgi:hypothetical protein